jgi:hypothetical protein
LFPANILAGFMFVINVPFDHVHRQGEANQAFCNPGSMKTKSKLNETNIGNINIKTKDIFYFSFFYPQ